MISLLFKKTTNKEGLSDEILIFMPRHTSKFDRQYIDKKILRYFSSKYCFCVSKSFQATGINDELRFYTKFLVSIAQNCLKNEKFISHSEDKCWMKIT